MNVWFNIHTLVALLIGVFGAAMIKGWIAKARGAVGA